MTPARRLPIAVGILTMLLTASCSSGDDPDAAPKTSQPAAASPAAKARLSKTWTPRLDKAARTARPNVCKVVGASGCTKHVTLMAEVVFALDDAIDASDAADRYPRSKAEIAKVTRASEDYATQGCADSNEPTLGNTPCAKAVADLLAGPATLSMTLSTDENKAD